MKKIFISLMFALLANNYGFAQSEVLFGKNKSDYSANPKDNSIRCVTDEYNKYLQSKGKESDEEFEAWLAPKVQQMRELIKNNTGKTVVKIPVVVHVIHSGQAVGTGRNISDDRVVSQITVLNQDYRKMEGTPGYNTNSVGADVEIEFCMAQVDPSGNTTAGIDRVQYTGYTWNESNVESVMKPQTIWDPTKYFNIWVCQFGGDLNGVLGYAQFPTGSGLSGLSGGTTTADTDGVVIDWRCFGTSDIVTGSYFSGYDKGRTATHEVGHAFGLRHIWGDTTSCPSTNSYTNKDYCADTPAANAANYTCTSVVDSCPSTDGNDMVENYMDYTYDTCMNIFTQDQKTRILTVIQNSPRRSTLPTSGTCDAPSLSVGESSIKDGLAIYPVPVKDYLNISATKGIKPVRYVIYNSVGQLVLKKEVVSDADLKVSRSKLGTGAFILTVYTEKEFKTFKFIVE